MKKLLLISNEVLHYRIKIYNLFYKKFKDQKIDLHVLSDSFQDVQHEFKFIKHELSFTIFGYLRKIREINPQYVILFLHLRNIVMIPVIWYCKTNKIPVIYWNHGIDRQSPNNKIKNIFYYYIHNICDALITYTPDMKNHFKKKNHHKLFVAFNTLYLNDINKNNLASKNEIKNKFQIKERKVILYISRMMPYKKVDLLMDSFSDLDDIAVVMVGPGFTEKHQKKVNAHKNLYYLGEKYGSEVNEVYKIGDIFSTPGHIGLAMNEALFWGIPVVLLKGNHAPEIYYMKNGITGYLAKDEADYKNYIIKLIYDDEKLKEMSNSCISVYDREANIDRMYQGFIDVIKYCDKKGLKSNR